MIALSGLTPHEDIEIEFTGMRPGEKLYEELSQGAESVTATAHEKIARLVTTPLHHSYVGSFLDELREELDGGNTDPAILKELLARMLPEYTPFKDATTARARAGDSEEPRALTSLANTGGATQRNAALPGLAIATNKLVSG
jgi:hypothetical protein